MRGGLFGTLMLAVAMVAPMAPATAGTPPLGGGIVFVDALGGSGIYAIAPDGTNRVLLVADDDETSVGQPRWAPDGSGIAFRVSRRQWSFRIDLVDDHGENRTTLISKGELPPGWAIADFAWSPDGESLVLALWDIGMSRSRLFVAASDGSSTQRIAMNAGSPDWSSTSRLVAVRDGDIVVMDPDGGNQSVIVDRGENLVPRWSPDGSSIVFERWIRTPGNPARSDVIVVNADGSGLTNLTTSPKVYDWSPSWSPTGSHIVWSPSPPGDSYGFGDLWRMRAAGGGKTAIAVTKRLDEYQADWADLPV